MSMDVVQSDVGTSTVLVSRGRDVRRALVESSVRLGAIAISVALALALATLLLAVTGNSASSAFSELWRGSFGSKISVFATLQHAAPIMAVAIAACVAGQAGLFNIGLEGQFLIGGLGATAVAVNVDAPRVVLLPLAFLAAVVGGAAWAGIAAFFRYRRGVTEVLTTLLLNFVAIPLVSWMVVRQYLLQATPPRGAAASDLRAESDRISPHAAMPILANGRGWVLSLSLVLSLVVAAVITFVVARTRWGLDLRSSGLNPRAARRFGTNVAKVGSIALLVSGGIAGFAAAGFLSSNARKLTPGFASNYGWEGLLVGLVAGFRPLVAVPVAIAFAALRAGGGLLVSTGISSNLVGVIQALVVLAATLPALYFEWRRRHAHLGTERT
jgi:simple sugar transport system permease protein